ncbi:MAG: protein kinase [Acidobacteriaceae bacterium]|nr:protein kinase [Acidobacteriaceae bacterium]MBV8570520.1 protein kinase [Acidobacteriaceae bacterium]
MLVPDKLRRPFLPLALLGALAVAGLCAECFWSIAWRNGMPVDSGWSAAPRGDKWQIWNLDPAGPAQRKLRPGDEITAVNGSEDAARFTPSRPLRALKPPSSYSIDVLRNGARQHIILPLWPIPDFAWALYGYLLLALVNLGLAVWIAIARPDYAPARIAFFLFLGGAATFAAATLQQGFEGPLHGGWLWLELIAGASVWRPLEWAVFYDFSLSFPEPLAQPRFLRIGRVLFYGLAGVLFVFGILPILAEVLNLPSRSSLLPRWFPLARFDAWRPLVSDALGAVVLLSTPVILARNYLHLPDPTARRRLRWVALGIGVSIIPMACGIALRFVLQITGHRSAAVRVDAFLDKVATFVLVLVPISITYAIVKHRILGIRLVIRRSVQYLLARNVLRIILYLPLIAIGIDILLHPRQGLADFLLHKAWWFYLAVIASASISLRFRSRLQHWVDRRFFRAAYEEQVILSDLIEQLQGCETSSEVVRVVCAQIAQTLQPSSVCVLFRNRSTGQFTLADPYDSPLALHFRRVLNERFHDAIEAERSSRTFSEVALQSQTSIDSEDMRHALITPIVTPSGELLAVLLLGEKRSEERYSNRDRRLLHAVATQIALVLEMVALRDQVREEGRVRVEVLARLEQDQIQLVLECPACGRCYSSPATQCEADQSALGFTLPIERTIEGKYRLDRRIGIGGMGAVYQACDLRLQREVAVKIMTGRLFGNTAALRRFEREARTAARLQHPGIVAIYDFGSLRGQGAYLVMQLVAGRSLRAEMAVDRNLRPDRIAAWYEQFCDAIACAHRNGVIHRDLKPENVLVSAGQDEVEKITVLDFGLAKFRSLAQPADTAFTTEDGVVGTLGYMSPEQRSGGLVDEKTDVYAMGVIAAELLTNRRPPASGASRKWVRSVLLWPASNLAGIAITGVLTRCLADAPAQRPSAEELQKQLVPLLSECPPLLVSPARGTNGTETVAGPV